MATPFRYFQQNGYYHVFNRGNRKQNIFLQPKDYRRFLIRMREYREKFGISIVCYCLMPNHYHLLVRQNTEISLSQFMLHLGTSYAKYSNIKYNEVGSLFQDRFKAKLIENDEYLLHLSRYIHRNPLKIIASTPGVELRSYLWSSYEDYLSEETSVGLDKSYILNYFSTTNQQGDYKNFVEYDIDDEDVSEEFFKI